METNTLLAIQQHPLRKKSRFASLSAKAIANRLLKADKADATVSPDNAAIRFYGLNQLVAVLSNKFTTNQHLPPWGQEIVNLYAKELLDQHRRLMWYTFLVISREWRHCKNLATLKGKKPALLLDTLSELHPFIHDSTSVSTLDQWLTKVPDLSFEHYCEALTYCFNNGSWSGGYGGKPWGNISKTLWDYVAGTISAEMFIDTAYTLAHNNGPMFNKGMLYGMYTSEFIKILDVQRSGQVCEALREAKFKSDIPLHLIEQVADAFPGSIGGYVDWYKVESLGALHSYPKEKKAQDQKYGKKPVMAVVNGQAVKYTNTFQWFPGKEVQVFERMA